MTPRTFERLTLTAFRARIALFHWTRSIDAVHVHATWRPTHADWKGEPSMQAMWRYHTVDQGWADIAQHLTIAPNGDLWTGRDWNARPASNTRSNGTALVGPFMFEFVGDFDNGSPDKLRGAQLFAAFGVIDAVLRRFDLPATSRTVVFHKHLPNAGKTCPGSAVDYGRFLDELAAYRAGYGSATTPT